APTCPRRQQGHERGARRRGRGEHHPRPRRADDLRPRRRTHTARLRAHPACGREHPRKSLRDVRPQRCPHRSCDRLHRTRYDYIGAGTIRLDHRYLEVVNAQDVLEMRAKARRLAAEQKQLDLIIVDYLQLMSGSSRRVESRQQEVSQISRELKGLAKELNVPLVALSQLSRAPEARSDHKPQLSDLRESGSIEQDADVVAFIYREEQYNRTEENAGLAEIIV